jgi:hypothetical protein
LTKIRFFDVELPTAVDLIYPNAPSTNKLAFELLFELLADIIPGVLTIVK